MPPWEKGISAERVNPPKKWRWSAQHSHCEPTRRVPGTTLSPKQPCEIWLFWGVRFWTCYNGFAITKRDESLHLAFGYRLLMTQTLSNNRSPLEWLSYSPTVKRTYYMGNRIKYSVHTLMKTYTLHHWVNKPSSKRIWCLHDEVFCRHWARICKVRWGRS